MYVLYRQPHTGEKHFSLESSCIRAGLKGHCPLVLAVYVRGMRERRGESFLPVERKTFRRVCRLSEIRSGGTRNRLQDFCACHTVSRTTRLKLQLALRSIDKSKASKTKKCNNMINTMSVSCDNPLIVSADSACGIDVCPSYYSTSLSKGQLECCDEIGLPDMVSASEGEGVMEKLGRLLEF